MTPTFHTLRSTGIMRNETVIGDPLYTIPLHNPSKPDERRNLCYEVHGKSNSYFNLISDECVSVNAHYLAAGVLNIIGAIGIRAEDDKGVCRDVLVNLNGCSVSTGVGGVLSDVQSGLFSMDGISIRKRSVDRVRISMPNCDSVRLIMWVICERGAIDMIRFQVARGINLRPTSHGLSGESNFTCEIQNLRVSQY